MTMILIDGFDHGDAVDVWTFNGGNSVTTTNARTGTHCLNMGINQICYRALGPTERDDGLTIGSGVLLGSNDIDGSRVMGHRFGEFGLSQHIEVRVYPPARSIQITRGQGFGLVVLAESDPNIITYDAWHYIETQVKIADADGYVEVRLDGSTVLVYVGDTQDGGTGIPNFVGIVGNGFSAQGCSFDDVYILNEQGPAPWNSFLGDTRCFPLYPNGNGNYSQLVGSDADSVDNYLLVDEVGTPSNADYVGSVTPGDKDTYLFGNVPVDVGTIRAVETRMYAAKTETGHKAIRVLIRRSGADVSGPDHVLAQDDYSTYRDLYQQDPHAGPGDWTIPNVNNTEFGAEVRAT
jgi:hypothetical protein